MIRGDEFGEFGFYRALAVFVNRLAAVALALRIE